MPMGTIRSGYGDHHSSWSQSFHARVVAQPSSWSSAWANTRPQNPVIIDGKLTEAHTPLRSMSRMRSWMSQQPARMSLNLVGSRFFMLLARPATAFMPTWVNVWPSNSQTSWPRSLVITFGRPVLKGGGQPALEHVRGLDEMVVDRDDRVADVGRLRIGQQAGCRSMVSVMGTSPLRARRRSGATRTSGRTGIEPTVDRSPPP